MNQSDQGAKNLENIHRVVTAINATHDLEKVGQEIVNIMTVALDSSGGALFLMDKENDALRPYTYSNVNAFVKRVIPLLSKRFQDHVFDLNIKKNFACKAALKKRIVVGSHPAEFFSPFVSKHVSVFIKKAIGLKTLVAAPAIINEEVVGVLVVGFTQESLPKETLKLLDIFSDHVAVAINNALKYRDLEKRYEAEKEITALFSHELKTPIANINNDAQRIKFFVDQHEKALGEHAKNIRALQKDIQNNVRRMNQISSSILSLHEVENGQDFECQNMNLNRTLDPIASMYQSKAEGKGLQFDAKFKILDKAYEMPGIQFIQVITILLENAIKYTQKGKISLKVFGDEKMLRCQVIDTGMGIPIKVQEKVFERFYQGKKKTGQKQDGIGIGLYLARKILDQMDGQIEIKSPYRGKGSSFTVKVPISC